MKRCFNKVYQWWWRSRISDWLHGASHPPQCPVCTLFSLGPKSKPIKLWFLRRNMEDLSELFVLILLLRCKEVFSKAATNDYFPFTDHKCRKSAHHKSSWCKVMPSQVSRLNISLKPKDVEKSNQSSEGLALYLNNITYMFIDQPSD